MKEVIKSVALVAIYGAAYGFALGACYVVAYKAGERLANKVFAEK